MIRLSSWVLCVAWVLWASANGFAQTPSSGDTSKTRAPQPKQVRPGFELPDSLYISADSIKEDIDTIIRYTAKDSTTFDLSVKRLTLSKNAVVQFQNREMDANTIVFDFTKNTLTAYSSNVDSVVNASLALRR